MFHTAYYEVDPEIKAISAVVLKLPDGKIAAERRRMDSPSARGDLQLFGGFFEKGIDESMEDCFLRELSEETDPKITEKDLLYVRRIGSYVIRGRSKDEKDRYMEFYEAFLKTADFRAVDGARMEIHPREEFREMDDLVPSIRPWIRELENWNVTAMDIRLPTGEVLLKRRSPDSRQSPSKLSLPGGERVYDGFVQEDVLVTARRRLESDTTVNFDDLALFSAGQFKDENFPWLRRIDVVGARYFGKLPTSSLVAKNPDEELVALHPEQIMDIRDELAPGTMTYAENYMSKKKYSAPF